MAIYPLFGFDFDEGQDLDDSLYFDSESDAQSVVVSEMLIEPPSFSYTFQDVWDHTIVESDDLVFSGVSPIDLSPLVPDKFLKSQTMLDLLAALNIEIGIWIKDIFDIQYLHDPNTVGEDNIAHLAKLISLTFIEPENSSEAELRRQLIEATQWYRIKGTYGCMNYVAGLSGLEVNLYDMYADGGWFYVVDSLANQVVTNDQQTIIDHDRNPYEEPFIEVGWFGAKYEEENPPGVPDTYFKTPHFVLEMVLNRYYSTTPSPVELIENYVSGFDYGETLSNLPLVPGTVKVYVSIGGESNIQVAVDNGAGVIASIPLSTYSVSGTVNYATGDVGINIAPGLTILDRVIVEYQAYSDWYLWQDGMFSKMGKMVEQVRPINTVPHFRCLLNGATTDDGSIQTIPETNVKTKVLTSWTIPRKYFDDGWKFDKEVWAVSHAYILEDRVSHGGFVYTCIQAHTSAPEDEPGVGVDWALFWLVNDVYFDQSFDSFLASITLFKVGTGNVGGDPGLALSNVVYAPGWPITSYEVVSGSVIFNMEIPAALEYSQLTEIGLFLSDGTTMVVSATMPAVDKTADIALKIVFTIGS
jgi:hypothetical protein